MREYKKLNLHDAIRIFEADSENNKKDWEIILMVVQGLCHDYTNRYKMNPRFALRKACEFRNISQEDFNLRI